MFQKKEYIYSEAMGVCRVEDVTSLSVKQGTPVLYYVLRSAYQKDKVAYIPVEHHAVTLRQLISKEEALRLREQWMEEENIRTGHTNTDSRTDVFGENAQTGHVNTNAQEDFTEETDWKKRFYMADTLPDEERERLYRKGEVEFVLTQEENTKKKKSSI